MFPVLPPAAVDELNNSYGKRPTGVRAISFDLDDTLWPFGPCLVRAEAALLDWLRANAPGTRELLKGEGAVRHYRDQAEIDHPELRGDVTALRFVAIRALLRDAREPEALVEPAFEAYYHARCRVDFYDDTLHALEFLSGRMPLVALSNGNASIERAGVAHFFKGLLNPASIGVRKPEAAAYHAAADLAGVAPAELLHVGDDWMYDVEGALGAGVQAAWLIREESGAAEFPWLRREGSGVKEHPQARERSCVITDLRQLCALLS